MHQFEPRNTQSDQYKPSLTVQYPSTVLLVHTDHFQYEWIIFITYGSFPIRTDHFQYVRIIFNTHAPFPTIWNTHKLFPIHTGHFQYVRVVSITYGSFSIHTYHFQHTQIFSNYLEFTQSISNTSSHFRTLSFQKLPYAFYLSPFDIIYFVQDNIYIPSNLCSHPKQSKPKH